MIRDEELLLYHYNEGLTAPERAAIASALQSDPLLALRLRQLLADLEALSSQVMGAQSRVVAPAAARARWSARLQSAARATARDEAASRARGRRQWGVTLAMCAVLTLGIAIGLQMQPPTPRVQSAANAGSTNISRPRFERDLRRHFANTERMLVGLSKADASTRGTLIAEVIEQNRLYARAAERAHEDQLARVLRSFDALLSTMAEADIAPSTFDRHSERLDFELSVMQTKLAQASSKPTLQL